MPVSKKIKVYIVVKISSRTILQYLPFCSISFGYGENKKNWLTKLKFPKLFSSCFMNACSKKNKSLYFWKDIVLDYSTVSTILFYLIWLGENKKNWLTKLKIPKLFSSYFINACFKKIKVYIVVKISSRTILQYLPFCSISFGYGENKKNWLTKLKFPKLFSSYFINACFKKIKVYIVVKISFRTILQYLPFCSISFGYGENKKNWLTKLKFPKLFSSCFMNACSKKNKSLYFWKDIVHDYSTVSTILFYLIWLWRK